MKQTIKQRNGLIMVDQKRRHEVCITPECCKDFGIEEEEQLTAIKGFFFGVAIGLVSLILTVSVLLW